MHPYRSTAPDTEYTAGELAWYRRPAKLTDLTPRESFEWSSIGLVVVCIFLFGGCVVLPHVDPAPRNDRDRMGTAVTIETYCNDDVVWSSGHVGQGVVVSERHVLTVAHVVSCAAIPRVYATVGGYRQRMVVTREDDKNDIARLELFHAGRFGLNIPPPSLGVMPPPGEATIGCVSRYLDYERCGTVVGPDLLLLRLEHGDSGAGVYDMYSGRLFGLVKSRVDWADPETRQLQSATRITTVDPTWLSGT